MQAIFIDYAFSDGQSYRGFERFFTDCNQFLGVFELSKKCTVILTIAIHRSKLPQVGNQHIHFCCALVILCNERTQNANVNAEILIFYWLICGVLK